MTDKIMNKKFLFLAMLLLCSGSFAMAAKKADDKKGEGKVILTTFGDLHTGFGEARDDRGFNLDRAYLGYQYNFNNGLELRTVADFGKSSQVGDMQRIGFVKHAWVGWRKNGWSVFGGLISTTQFKFQEDFWGKRYVMKSFQDEYKFGSSADVGVSAAYKFNKILSVDAIIVNGEGYKKIQINDGLQYGLGVTLSPFEGFYLRAYGSYHEATLPTEKGIGNIAGFAGYKNDCFSLAAEYNYMWNNKNIEGDHLGGISAYGSVASGKRTQIFARWDKLDSKNDWNKEKDGMSAMAGVEVKLGKVKLAPNLRLWMPDDTQLKNVCELYINASFSL